MCCSCSGAQENELPLCELEYLLSYPRIILSGILFGNARRYSTATFVSASAIGGSDRKAISDVGKLVKMG